MSQGRAARQIDPACSVRTQPVSWWRNHHRAHPGLAPHLHPNPSRQDSVMSKSVNNYGPVPLSAGDDEVKDVQPPKIKLYGSYRASALLERCVKWVPCLSRECIICAAKKKRRSKLYGSYRASTLSERCVKCVPCFSRERIVRAVWWGDLVY